MDARPACTRGICNLAACRKLKVMRVRKSTPGGALLTLVYALVFSAAGAWTGVSAPSGSAPRELRLVPSS